MPASWLTSGLPKIQTDLKALRQSRRTRKLQTDLHESPSTSSSSRSSSFIVTPSSSQPYKAQFSPLNNRDDLYCINDAAAPSSTLTLQPVRTKVAHNSPQHLDRGAIRHSKGSTPFEKTDHGTTGRGRSNTRTSSGHAMASVEMQGYVKGVDRHMSPREDPRTQTTHSSHQPTLGLERGSHRLSFPKIRRRDAYDSNDAGSSCSHATSQPGSPIVALSRSSSLRSKYKLGAHRFLVSQKVGEGGFGQVFKAIEIHTGHIVAVKTVSRKGLSRSRVNATLKEQKVARRIAKHQREACDNGGDFVVRMLASFLTLNHFVFVLDYHGAGDLRDVDFPLKTQHARFYIGEMALGLRFIHSLDIVMRDLKPANVLLDFSGHIKLADFGLSAMSDQDIEPISSGAEAERPTSVLSFVRTRTISLGSSSLNIPTLDLGHRKRSKTTGHVPKFFKTSSSKGRSSERQRCPMVFCGTPGYISPEGYKGRYGPENDMWALGISLYEFITGENPFDMWGVPTSEIQKKVEDTDIYYPEGMPPTTQDIIGQLLKRKWQNRMTIDELMEHPFFRTDDFSWEELQQKKLVPPPLPDIALRRLRQSQAVESQQPQMPLILHLEAEAMRMKDGFVEELGSQEMCDFEMDGLDILPSLKEERRVEGSEDDVWW